MRIEITPDDFRHWREEYAKRKEPIDSDIEKREKTAGDPPADTIPNPEKGGPSSATNPDNSTAPSRDQAKEPLSKMPWFMGSADMGGYILEAELDSRTGLAKWPLSFKRIEKDTKRPNKPYNRAQDVPKKVVDDQPSTTC